MLLNLKFVEEKLQNRRFRNTISNNGCIRTVCVTVRSCSDPICSRPYTLFEENLQPESWGRFPHYFRFYKPTLPSRGRHHNITDTPI